MAFGMQPLLCFSFGAEDLNPVTLGKASECVYYHFFWTPTSHTLHQLSEETIDSIGHMVVIDKPNELRVGYIGQVDLIS